MITFSILDTLVIAGLGTLGIAGMLASRAVLQVAGAAFTLAAPAYLILAAL